MKKIYIVVAKYAKTLLDEWLILLLISKNLLKMKILHIVEPLTGGVLAFMRDLTKGQVGAHEVYVAYGLRVETPPDVEELFDKRIHMIKVPAFDGAVKSLLNSKSYMQVRRIYDEIKPDIVHMHSSASGFIGRWSIPVGSVTALYTPHGYSFLMKDSTLVKRAIYWFIEWLSAKRKSTTIACSYGEYKESLNLTKYATYVNNGVNTEELDACRIGERPIEKQLRVCTMGRVMCQKNPALFNQVALALPEVEFTWIGGGDMFDNLTAPNIKVTGWMERKAALRLMQEHDVFMLTSLWEGLPIALLEAMYLNMVCLVSNVIGNRDVIRNGENGFICQRTEDFVSTLHGIISKRIDGQIIAENAHEDVAENYNASLMAEKYMEIYNRQYMDKKQITSIPAATGGGVGGKS